MLISCRKTDVENQQVRSKIEIITKFFKHSTTDTTLNAIIESIKRQNDKRDFVVRLTHDAGYPIWDEAKVSMKDDKKQVFIPFVLENAIQTNAILIARLSGGDTLYHLLYGAAYKKYGFDKDVKDRWTAREVFTAFAIFDKEIFGHEKFMVKDDRLLGADNNNINNAPLVVIMKDSIAEQNARTQRIWYFIHTVTWVICGECYFAKTMTDPCCNATYYTDVLTFWFDDGVGGGPNYEWGWFPPEGGGGGGGVPCPGCNWDNTNPCEEQDPNQPQFPCDQDWRPVVNEVQEVFDVNNYDDTVGISDALESAYPCTYAFIKDSLPNINYLAQLAGASVFGDSVYMHLSFDTSTTQTSESDKLAITSSDSLVRIINGQTHFSSTIELNGWYLRNSTKEAMISTIIHEVMHAVIRLRWGQYEVWRTTNPHVGTIDSFFMKEHFPIYWNDYVVNGVPQGQLNSHQIMGTDYKNFFTSLVAPFYNSSAPSNTRDTVLKAMGYGGIKETTAWKILPSQGIDTCKYKLIDLAARKSRIGTYTVGGCTGAINYLDSLKLTPNCN